MAVLSLSPEEYLQTSFRPDRDYLDGRAEERNWGEFDHSTCQSNAVVWLRSRDLQWGTRSLAEIRVNIGNSRYRVPDVCVLRRESPIEQVILTPPLICLEVVSPDDRLSRLYERLEDYRSMGVENIWVVDPGKRTGYTFGPEGLREYRGDRFEVAESEIYLPLAEVFAGLE